MTFDAIDHAMMARALRLAERGLWTTRPNPRVGCVLVRDGEIVGEGWHRRAGGPHAEVFALREAGDRARGATAYVTLEPCAHHGRTPPCADALIAAGIARVVAAVRDPFPEVDGRGSEKLRAAGIALDGGLMEADARALNAGFFSRIERGRPWLRVKLACSLDGRTALASGESKWITGEAARADVQRWRARACAVLTGAGTLRADDPQLTARVDGEIAPLLRIVVSNAGVVPKSARMFGDGNGRVIVAHPHDVAAAQPDGVEAMPLPRLGGQVDLYALAQALAARGINEVQVEAGPILSGALLRAGLVDELLLYQSPQLLGERGRALFAGIDPARMDQAVRLQCIERRMVGDDQRLRLVPRATEGRA